jgi:hypothetical protein
VTAKSNRASGRAGAPSGSSQSASSRAKPLIPDAGFTPGPWSSTQYGYEKYAITDSRGTEIGFVHRRGDASLASSAPVMVETLGQARQFIVDACSMIDTIKVEWKQIGHWTEGDQALRDRATATILAIDANLAKARGAR